jgi:sugar lactone lactonase YvrE
LCMTTRSHLFKTARPALAGLGALALVAACSSTSSSPSPGAASFPAFSSAPTTGVSSPSATLPSASLSASASPGASGSPEASGALAECTTVATGLLNPRGMTIADDGTVYVTEAGTGGTEPDFATAPVGSPGPGESLPAASAAATAEASPGGSPAPVTTHGETGQVTKIGTDGTQSVLVGGLTSYNFMGEVVGPAGVVAGKDGTVYVSIGGPGPGTSQFEPAGNADSVVKVDSAGTVTELANIGQYERENNPDPNAVDSNVGGMAMGADGLLYVADSGGNDLYSVNPDTGELKVVAVIPGLPSVNGAPNPARGNKPEVDPVPTSVVADPKGGVFVGLLTGAALWATPGSAEVIHVGTDGKIDDAVKGLNMVTGVAVKDDSIYASELSTNFLATPPQPGQLSKASVGGTPGVVFSGLALPYGIAVAPDGKSIDIVINSTGEPGTTPNGQVINCPLPESPVASPKATETPAASASPLVTMPAESASPETTAPASMPAESLPASSPSLAPATL